MSRDEWTAYTEIGRAGIEQARAALEQTEVPELAAPEPPTVRTPNELDFPPPSVSAGLDVTPEATP